MKQMSRANRRRFRKRMNEAEQSRGLTLNHLFPILLVTGYIAAKWDTENNEGRNIKACTLDFLNFIKNSITAEN